MTKEFILPVEAEKQLMEIFTPQYMDAVKDACRRYLRDSVAVPENKKEVVVADAKTLEEIANKARELRKLLKNSNRALKRVNLHMMDEYKKTGVLMDMIHLQDELRTLENMCVINPACEIAETPKKGKIPNLAGRAFAFNLWAIYKQAHGKTAKRGYDNVKNIEIGPLPRATNILKPILKLEYNFVQYFRKIGEDFNKTMDIKSKTK
ncbi:MAG: hypothetical protein CVU51_02955 [Deltaproteobacteria bacterium HGW-Deltaproteobacteria-1]|jgi:hypothetical protein|nr:MAG: hypothetical protein CVU51_02955 [Deltaproteobacteria bacterium HGW-Deltaproteobacteria-1]